MKEKGGQIKLRLELKSKLSKKYFLKKVILLLII